MSITNQLKRSIKRCASIIPVERYHRLMMQTIMMRGFGDILRLPVCVSKTQIWDEAVKRIGADAELTYIEFGVYKGDSIKYVAQQFINPNSEFLGFDSFEGLPEQWGDLPKGTFSTNQTNARSRRQTNKVC